MLKGNQASDCIQTNKIRVKKDQSLKILHYICCNEPDALKIQIQLQPYLKCCKTKTSTFCEMLTITLLHAQRKPGLRQFLDNPKKHTLTKTRVVNIFTQQVALNVNIAHKTSIWHCYSVH